MHDTATPDIDGIAVALGRIPSGLFIVTWQHEGRDRGMLASWVMQAGFDPPAVSLAVASGRDLLPHLHAGGEVVINVLAEDQRSLLARFAKPAAEGDPFAGLELSRATCGAAVLPGAAAWIGCRPNASAAAGDHEVFVATITSAVGHDALSPAVHLRRSGLRY